jgi:carbamoyltransferase
MRALAPATLSGHFVMLPKILGVSAFYHDSAAAFVHGGDIIAAAQEERFTRKKHDARFPGHAVNYCLEEAFVEGADVDVVAFYDNSARTLDRVIRNFATVAPKGAASFVDALGGRLGDKLALRETLAAALGAERPLWYVDHHLSHAASAFYPSPFDSAAILTIDGVGEHATCAIGHGRGRRIELTDEIHYPHSLGLLYSAIAAYCGFRVNSGEYKLMGLAPYGEPRYAEAIETHLIAIAADGSFSLDMDYFDFPHAPAMGNERLCALFGGPPRAPESRLTIRYMDVAASIQKVTEKIVLRLATHALRRTGERNIALAGGVALNCVAVGQLHRAGVAERIWTQPAAGDAGGALGAALYAAHVGFEVERRAAPRGAQKGGHLGPSFGAEAIRAALDACGAVYARMPDASARCDAIARALADGAVVGLFSGRAEFGPRALGARSILGDPRRPDMQSKMNLKIKYRESFRPFAPAILHDRVGDYFEYDRESPYMLMVAPIRDELRLPFDWGDFRTRDDADMLEIVNRPRSPLPAVTHVDYSARLQTVHPDDNPEFHRILSAFDALTDCPALINTSFNVRGEPIVHTPDDAYRCFRRTEMDLLAIGEFLLWKDDQPERDSDDSWRSEFELD